MTSIASAIRLKSELIDYYIFFLVFLFGVQTPEDAMKVIKGLVLGAVFANVITVLDAFGVVSLGFRIRDDGRTAGAIGESNQYAAFIVLFLPATIAAAVSSRGFQRLFWLGSTMVAALTLVMTASRGGFVGLAMCCAVGAFLYRHLISYSRIAGWVFAAMILLVLVVTFSPYGNLLAERMMGTGSIDREYGVFGTQRHLGDGAGRDGRASTHLHHGLRLGRLLRRCLSSSRRTTTISICGSTSASLGLACGTYVLFSGIGRARRASLQAAPPYRGQLIAFVLGVVGVATAVFFVDLHQPWYYFWMYAGVVMRLVLLVQRKPAKVPVTSASDVPLRLPTSRRDPYGWAQPQVRS